MCLFEKISVNTIVPTIPIVCAMLSMSENPITIPSTIRQNRIRVDNKHFSTQKYNTAEDKKM
jgi:hypothetical protein